jgi:hypothetical protein
MVTLRHLVGNIPDHHRSGVAQRYAPFAFLCGSSPAHEVSRLVFHAVLDVSMLRIAEPDKLGSAL